LKADSYRRPQRGLVADVNLSPQSVRRLPVIPSLQLSLHL